MLGVYILGGFSAIVICICHLVYCSKMCAMMMVISINNIFRVQQLLSCAN